MTSLGFAALCLALFTAIASAGSAVLGARRHHTRWVGYAESGLWATAAFVVLSTVVLLFLLLTRDFRVQYVYAHTSTYQSIPYLISALWAGQEGSLLLWLLFLSVVTAVILTQKRQWPIELWPYVLAVMASIQAFFALILVAQQNPFTVYAVKPLEGIGLLPALENPGMLFHPPILFLGYALYSVPFAFTWAQLITGPARAQEHGWPLLRVWSLVAWCFLGLGILLGAWWAYVELGWGGYWAWDPVETASLVPWLVGTAYLHALLVQERQGFFRRWSAALAIAVFLLCIFGTLVTRGGIIVSDLHGFSSTIQPIAYYLLGLIAVVLVGSAALFYARREQLNDTREIERLFSRESGMLLTNLLLVGLAGTILVGMIFPTLTQLLQGVQWYLGSTFYNRVFVPLGLALIGLLGICIWLDWTESSPRKLLHTLSVPVAVTVVTIAVSFGLGVRRPLGLCTSALIAFAISSIIGNYVYALVRVSRARQQRLLHATIGLFRSTWRHQGARLIHLAILLIAMGIAGSSLYKTETLISLRQGETSSIQNYRLVYEDLQVLPETGKQRFVTTLFVYRGAKRVGILHPEKSFYSNVQDYATEVAILSTFREDLYVALDGIDQNGLASFRINVNPLVLWIWIGGGLLLLGTLIALWPNSLKNES